MRPYFRWGNQAVWLATAALGWAVAGAAGAQTVPASAESEEIIVLGEKTERSLQDTVSSVAVTTAARIEDENILSLNDIVNRTANVAETYGSAGFTIRGIDNRDVSGGGVGGMVTVYVDGAPLPDGGVFAGPLNMWDVNQVEILRGPQSTLQGRNALAGSVIVRSREPSYEWDAHGRVLITDAGESFAVAGGGPIVADQVAFRIAIEDRHQDGFVENLTRGENEDELDNLNARVRLLIEPDAIPDLRLLASYTRSEREAGYQFTYVQTNVPDYFDNRTALSNDPNSVENESDFYTLEGSYDLSERFSLTSVTTYSEVDDRDTYDNDYGPAAGGAGGSTTFDEAFTQELRLNFDGAAFDGLAGLYYSNRDIAQRTQSFTNVPLPTADISLLLQSGILGVPFTPADADAAAAFYESLLPVISVDYDAAYPSQVETVALFADGAWQIAPRWSLIGGFRYDREEYTIAVDQETTFIGTLPDPFAYPGNELLVGGLNLLVLGYVAQANATAPPSTREFEAFLPKLGVTYDWNDDVSTSFVVQRGYRSGGSSVNIARSSIVPYDQEYTTNYEFSFRSQWLDDTLTINANAFYLDWTDQQVIVYLSLSNPYDYQTENAGSSSLYGFEVELTHRPTDNFEWYATLGHTITEFDDFTVSLGTAQLDLSGSEFSNAPHWTLSAGATQRWDNGWLANVNAAWRDESYAGVGIDQAIYAIDARTLVNGRFGYEADHWGVYVFGNNLFDEHYVQYPHPFEPLAIIGDPRVIGVGLEARF